MLGTQEFKEHLYAKVRLAKDGSKSARGQFWMQRNDHNVTLFIPQFDMTSTLANLKKSRADERTHGFVP
jgi:hypothetical protein